MPTPGFSERFCAELPSEYTSRGTGEAVPLQETTTLDFMPQLLGSRFMAISVLKQNIYQNGARGVSFIATEEAHRGLAEDELREGNLTNALEAYKRALYNGTAFVRAMALLKPGEAAFTTEEVDKLNLSDRYGSLEDQLLHAVVSREVSFNPGKYADFVNEVRGCQKKECQLGQLYWLGESNAYEPLVAERVEDPILGKEYMELCATMGYFWAASLIASKIGLDEASARYSLLDKDQLSQVNPKELLYLDMVAAKYDRY